MIILSKKVKVWVQPSVNPHAITNHVGCKIGRKDTVLCDMDGKAVHDVNDKKTCALRIGNHQ